MADQILSQDEIDALISAMDSGEVDLEGDAEQSSGVKSYDLTAQHTRVLSGEFEALELVHEEFVKLLRSSLSSSLGRGIEVKFLSSEMMKFGVFLQSFSNPTGFSIFAMEPFSGQALLVMEPGLAFSLIDCMFGGTGRPINTIREFTYIEQGVVKKVSLEILRVLERAWSVVLPVEVALKKQETKPQFVHLTSPDDAVISVVFSIAGEEFNGNIHVCIPYLMLEPAKEKLSFKTLGESDESYKRNEYLLKLFNQTNVHISVELGRAIHSIGDVLNLQIGDVIKLNSGPQDPVLLKVEGIPKFHGFPGIVKGNRAVEITSILRGTEGR